MEHGGTIDLMNRDQGGLRARVVLPLAMPTAAAQDVSEQPEEVAVADVEARHRVI